MTQEEHTPPTITWEQAADQFWDEVVDLLTQKYGHTPEASREGIRSWTTDFMRRAKVKEIPRVIYNKGEVEAARTVDWIIRNGLPA